MYKGWERFRDVPNTSVDLSLRADSEKGIGCSGHMEVCRLLISEERIWHPDLVGHFSSDRHLVEVGTLDEGESFVSPRLSEVEIRREVLKSESSNQTQTKTRQQIQANSEGYLTVLSGYLPTN